MADEKRRKLTDKYLIIDNVYYQPPDTILIASRKMSKYQANQDMFLKRVQYLLSGVFRPLDVLGLKISLDIQIYILNDIYTYLGIVDHYYKLYQHKWMVCITTLRASLSIQISYQTMGSAFITVNEIGSTFMEVVSKTRKWRSNRIMFKDSSIP